MEKKTATPDPFKPLIVGNTIQFDYKRGPVICELIYVGERQIEGKLMIDYYGRNDDWYTGESKLFNIKEMKNIHVLKYKQ
jgi:hypothetical protein